ncbi:hypothetical protein P2Q66_10850 [Arthrobacter sp. Cr_A7]|nr:hypothetical protein [Arthrobacter sp. Cr_A7]MDF2050434.1 hypothetical protein [Arthrobacter sp. Cr_A7]
MTDGGMGAIRALGVLVMDASGFLLVDKETLEHQGGCDDAQKVGRVAAGCALSRPAATIEAQRYSAPHSGSN